MNVKSNFILIVFIILHANSVHGEIVTCFNGLNSKPSQVEILASSCELQKKLAIDEIIQKEYQRFVHKQLAKKLANQISQNSEELSLLTTFFSNNKQDLLMNNPDTAKNCRLENIKQIETCGGKTSSPLQKEKLEMLISMLPKNDSPPFNSDTSLYGSMAAKFYSDLGMKAGQGLQCPINGQSGYFMIDSQIDEDSATKIIEDFNNKDIAPESIFDNYAQLKLISSTNDPIFIKSFIGYLKNKPKNLSSKEYISDFFFNAKMKNYEKLAPAVAKKCEMVNKNINQFICSDMSELGSLDDTASQGLFSDLSTLKPLADQTLSFTDPMILIAYGMQCIAKEKKAAHTIQTKESIDQWYNDFNQETRSPPGKMVVASKVASFCKNYACESENSKKAISCQKGGPLSSEDFAKIYNCPDPVRCKTDILKSISLLEKIEKIKKESKKQNVNTSAHLENSSKKDDALEGHLPNFAENYFGVEGTLKALGQPLSPAVIAEKEKDFEKRELVTKEPIYNSPTVTNTQKAKDAGVKEAITTSSSQGDIKPDYTPTRITETHTAIRPTVASTPRSETTSRKILTPDDGAMATKSSSQLRSEMEQMIKDLQEVKATEAQRVNMPGAQPTAGSEKTKNDSKSVAIGVNSAESQRLKNWADRLEQYKEELDRREYMQRVASQETPAAKAANTIKNGTSDVPSERELAGASNGGGGNSSSSGSVPKLTSGSQKTDSQKGNGALASQNGKEVAEISAEDLLTISPENLKKEVISSTKPYILKINFKNEVFEVIVKAYSYKGGIILKPISNSQNVEFNQYLKKSALFKAYYDWEKQNE